ncbi:MAG: twin-arginine translocase TatA/TatE family subunit [Methyloceanibacter sp.]
MGLGSGWHWLLVLLVFVLLFGAGKISGLMGDLAKGIKSFKKEMAEGGEEPAEEPAKPEAKVIEHNVEKPARTTTKTASKAPRSRKSG